ncbi:MAG TPA: S8 family serine peptidase, partial [Candidatus Limnocylindria bacterium]|nr:S8 family serine peptidase [Candidatus Limnocylindria bacterium]
MGALAISFLLFPVLAGPVSAVRGETVPVPAPNNLTQDSWIVQLRPGVSPAAQALDLSRLAGGRAGLVFQIAINGFQFRGTQAAAQMLARHPWVESVRADRPIHLVESLPNGIERIWAYDNDSPADSAYHQGFRGNGARIAVLDTGIDLDHPDLVGAIDQGLGKNCVNPALPPEDGYGHGTHVSGTAAAPINGVGVVGVAPESRLVPVKVFDDAGNSSEALVLCGFNHVLALNADVDPGNDVDVMSMSFGEDRAWGDCVTDALHEAVCNAYAAGIIMVAGAGNSAANAGTFVPAAFPEVISVSALADFDATRGGLAGCGLVPDLGWFDCDDTFAFFSNYGASVDVIAPGVSIFSTTKNGGYATQSGTSMATPHVSGVVALMAAANPGLTPAAARAFLQQSGECPNGSVAGADGACDGQGTWADDPDGTPEPMANALRAALAAGGSPPTPTPPAAPTLTSATAGDASVALSWTVPADGGSLLSGYEVWRGTVSGTTALLAAPVGLQTTFTDLTAANGTTYYYQVRAVNGVGPGPLSNEMSATPLAPPPTVTRIGGTVSNFASATSSSGSLAFSPPAGSNALVAMVSVSHTTVTLTAVTWRPDPANPGADQALTFVGRRVAPSAGAVEIWAL